MLLIASGLAVLGWVATSSVITNADGEEVSEFTVDSLTEALQIDVTNTFDVGSIKVEKKVVGEGPSRFEVKLACTHDVDGTAIRIDIPGGAERTLAENGDFTTTYTDLPAGAACTLVRPMTAARSTPRSPRTSATRRSGR